MLTISRTCTEPVGYATVKEFFNSICSETQSPVALQLLKSNDLEISRFRIRPEDYSSAKSFREDYLLTSILSKWKGLETGIDTKEAAISAFEKQETTCAVVNNRLRKCFPTLNDPVLHRTQRLIASLLGPFSLLNLRGLERWGPGATTDLRRSAAYMDTKMTKLPIPVTLEARRELALSIEEDLHWSAAILGDFPVGPYRLLPDCFAIVQGSDITVVSKNAKTGRTIAIEPRGNMFLQKAVGIWLRRRLKRWGIDLNDQGLNQAKASQAHLLNLSTIDLSMASDSIVEELIFMLLPIEWALYLNSIRSKRFRMEGSESYTKFEKFSSMGNGFTFELESLIFAALAKAVEDNDSSVISVYGDDIICHRDDAPVLISVLSYLGFETNVEKTYIEGRFFESCGRHYFDGTDVTPFYQKELVTDYSEHVRFINRLARYLARHCSQDDQVFSATPGFKTWVTCLTNRLGKWTPLIPLGTEGDDGYLVTASLWLPRKFKKSYGNQWTISVREKITIPGDDSALLAYSLRQNSNPEGEEGLNRTATLLSEHTSFPGNAPSCVNIESRSAKGRLSLSTRWIDPSWEYFLH